MTLSEALTATFAALGQEMPDVGVALMARDLSAYPLADVFAALTRCRKELRRIVLADILERIPGGHPGPEEAWGIVAKCLNDERVTVVWTDPMCKAFGVALDLQDDHVAARMAFKEVYARLVAEAREARAAVVWIPSLGQDPHGREPVLLEALERGRLSAEHVAGILPYREEPAPRLAALLDANKVKELPSSTGPVADP